MVERNGWSRYEEAWDIASFSFLRPITRTQPSAREQRTTSFYTVKYIYVVGGPSL